MAMPILSTKLYVPPVRPDLVRRPRLVAQLDEGLHRRLILISSPAGFGKTTLISAWLRDSGRSAAWISLDDTDNDPARFLSYLVAALRTVEADMGRGALSALQSPQPPDAESLLTALINEIGSLPHDLILVLDDYHLITAPPVHETVSFLLEHLPPRMHVLIATRADPPLPIARLRGRGQLVELRQTDLRFSLKEATAFLNEVMGLSLTGHDVAALTLRTEGWITGLQMAAIALQASVTAPTRDAAQASAFIQAFTGSNRYVLDYLVEEVLQRQPETIQIFLLQTAILDRLSGPLCDAILAGTMDLESEAGRHAPYPTSKLRSTLSDHRSPSQTILEDLEAANLFVVPLDNERHWYRYHRLFADLLRKRLAHMQPEQVPLLHRRASAWYEQEGLVAEAIDHALAAEDYERAAGLIEQIAEAILMRSEIATFKRWIESLPNELVRSRPTLCLYHAWALLWSGRSLETIEARLNDVDIETKSVANKVNALRAFVAVWQGQVSRSSRLAKAALETLPEDESFLRGVAAWNLGISHMLDGNFEAGSEVFDKVIAIGQKTGNVMMAVSALCQLAESHMSGAQLYRARDLYQRALELARDEQGHPLPISGMVLIGLGELSREWNELEEAVCLLTEGIERITPWGEFGAIDGYIALARTRQAQGDAEGARELLQKAQQAALEFDVSELDDEVVAMHQVQLWLLQGNLPSAVRWLEQRGYDMHDTSGLALSSGHDGDPSAMTGPQPEAGTYLDTQLRNYECILLARALLVQERPVEALELLESQIAKLKRQGRHRCRRMIGLLNLKSLALQAQGRGDEALASLEVALSIGEQGGYVRIFVDEGEPMLRLLRQAATQGMSPEYVGKLIAAFSAGAGWGATAPSAQPGARPPAVQPLAEPLSDREMDVLRLLGTGMSNPEIADHLYIATSTVRSHLKNIYGKLNVHRRWDAVQRAEELGLL